MKFWTSQNIIADEGRLGRTRTNFSFVLVPQASGEAGKIAWMCQKQPKQTCRLWHVMLRCFVYIPCYGPMCGTKINNHKHDDRAKRSSLTQIVEVSQNERSSARRSRSEQNLTVRWTFYLQICDHGTAAEDRCSACSSQWDQWRFRLDDTERHTRLEQRLEASANWHEINSSPCNHKLTIRSTWSEEVSFSGGRILNLCFWKLWLLVLEKDNMGMNDY